MFRTSVTNILRIQAHWTKFIFERNKFLLLCRKPAAIIVAHKLRRDNFQLKLSFWEARLSNEIRAQVISTALFLPFSLFSLSLQRIRDARFGKKREREGSRRRRRRRTVSFVRWVPVLESRLARACVSCLQAVPRWWWWWRLRARLYWANGSLVCVCVCVHCHL